MGYKNIVNLLNNTSNQPAKFRTRDLVEKNYESRETYNTNSQSSLKLQC